MSKLRALGKYLKEQHTNGRQMYSALFLTAATIATGGVFGWAALGAATLQHGIAMAVAGTVGIGLGAYAGAPMVKEFVTGAIDAVKNADSEGGSKPGKASRNITANVTGPKQAQKKTSAWDKIKSLTSAFRHATAPQTAIRASVTTPRLRRTPGLG